MKLDFQIYTVHWMFWGAFGLTRIILRRHDRKDSRVADAAPVSQKESTAPFSRALLAFHALAFGLMYFGIGYAVIPGRVPRWFPGQRIAGTLVIAAGGNMDGPTCHHSFHRKPPNHRAPSAFTAQTRTPILGPLAQPFV